jgi:nucleoside-diphosphate-sugar epimerase
LGTSLCASLTASGHEVVATGRRAMKGMKGFETKIADLTNMGDVERLFADELYDAVIHCAAVIRGQSDEEYFLDNVSATNNLAYAAKRNGVSKFLFMSTISVYDGEGPFDETSRLASTGGYAISKIVGEHALQLLANERFRVVALRLAGLHGAARRSGVVWSMISAAAEKKPLTVSEPDTVFSLTLLEDIGAGVDQLFKSNWSRPYSVYNFANPNPHNLRDLAKLVICQLGSDSAIELGHGKSRNRGLVVDRLFEDHGILLTSTKKRISEIVAAHRRQSSSGMGTT